ncbi:MAG TPA: hypothetical protein VME17_03870 [Bryobacteraceae bacterium]|nr:hypothetical protein [Bryobacteraceae bacterium]
MIVLSDDVMLVYVLAESGVRGQLTSGRIERGPAGTLDIFDILGNRFDYLSGGRLRSWCVVGPEGKPVDGWREIRPEDVPKIFPQ